MRPISECRFLEALTGVKLIGEGTSKVYLNERYRSSPPTLPKTYKYCMVRIQIHPGRVIVLHPQSLRELEHSHREKADGACVIAAASQRAPWFGLMPDLSNNSPPSRRE